MDSLNIVERLDTLTPAIFSMAIESVVKETGLNYIQAIIHYCDSNSIDIEAVPQFLSSSMKSKIQMDAEDLHLLPKSSKLPI